MAVWLQTHMINAIVGTPTIGTPTEEVAKPAPIIL